ncbi:MAG: hypothetical protein HC866_24230 [Leptolyngbyaceae cyanobacterium RU_5_1]|nr:hypothetical protein [Leptolyngbyaceae cyanobacterium RU_5_1]
MLRTSSVALALSLSSTTPFLAADFPKPDRPHSTPSLLAADFPKPDRDGDYSGRTSHQNWLVVDADANGLNCRWFSTTPTDWYSPTAKLPLATINQWRVVRRFKRNTPLTANTTPAGFATIADTENKPWLKVSIGANDQVCLVRANARYIRPIQR